MQTLEEVEEKTWFGIDWLKAEYMWVWVALLVLTILEVLVPEPESFGLGAFPDILMFEARTIQVVLLIGLAISKTFLVAWYYMHLVSERPAIILVACAPFIFSVFLTIGLFPWPA
ncbi:MAG: cytochrome C oxidase subunit IV family protein [Persicimonas sp.]